LQINNSLTSTAVTPACQHFGVCGGCSLQHLNPEAYAVYKKQLVIDALTHQGINDVIVNEPIIIPANNRRRANLKAALIQDKIKLGYHGSKSHEIIDISQCPLVVPDIERLIPHLRPCLKVLLKAKQKADIFITMTEPGLDILFIINGLKSLSLQQTERLMAFGIEHNIARMSLRSNGVDEPIVTFRSPVISYGGVPVETNADGFMQASVQADQILIQRVLDSAPHLAKRSVDLFCGRGTFTLPLSVVSKVDAYELDANALTALERAKNKHQRPINTFHRNLFDEPLAQQELDKYDFAVINPPRAGAFRQCQALAQSKIPAITMVSCYPKTFARDANILMQGGYALNEVTPVDQFLWSNHVEVVGCFVRHP
jgi:23S rRNA (uracil1939-C5)-methyltransferase